MDNYLGVNIEFNRDELHRVIEDIVGKSGKGYICVIDGNVLRIAQESKKYRSVLNNATVNTCDGSSIALLASIAHRRRLLPFNGPELFRHYVKMGFKQVLLGSDKDTVQSIKAKVRSISGGNSDLMHIPLPILSVSNFNYPQIASQINNLRPELIWVSLGAPKQELFIKNIIPYIDSGMLIAIGAAFNFYIGEIKLPTYHIFGLKFIWISRLIKEPLKSSKRICPYVTIIPRLYYEERKKINRSTT